MKSLLPCFLAAACTLISAESPVGHATTGSGFPAFDLNATLGANRYTQYATPITGQNTITSNLEAGHIWNGHETLTHVTAFTDIAASLGKTTSDFVDRHATWVGMLIGGRQTAGGGIYQQGIAPGTDLRSAAIATGWTDMPGGGYSTSFSISYASLKASYEAAYEASDVVNSSYGSTDPGGTGTITYITDGAAFANPLTTHVVSAGNAGPFPNTVGSPGSGYNQITVGALGSASGYNDVAEFSSRSPQDFGYLDGDTGQTVTVSAVRAAVDISAPGEDLSSAYYGGQTGGNDPGLTGTAAGPSDDDFYSNGINGTSFAAPLVAGGASLVTSAAKTLPGLSDNTDASQSMVVKALLLTGADKTTGWNNGQTMTEINGDSVLFTGQSLDWDTGAGRMNLDRTFDIQVNGQTDVAGLGTGSLGTVETSGWDFGAARFGTGNEYILDGIQSANSTLTSTVSWMRFREWDTVNDTISEIAQADLNLSVWLLDESLAFIQQIARSGSLYNTVEHLAFALPETGRYGLRVEYDLNTFDNTTGDVWGATGNEQLYGLAWEIIVVPEPAFWIMATAMSLALVVLRRKPA